MHTAVPFNFALLFCFGVLSVEGANETNADEGSVGVIGVCSAWIGSVVVGLVLTPIGRAVAAHETRQYQLCSAFPQDALRHIAVTLLAVSLFASIEVAVPLTQPNAAREAWGPAFSTAFLCLSVILAVACPYLMHMHTWRFFLRFAPSAVEGPELGDSEGLGFLKAGGTAAGLCLSGEHLQKAREYLLYVRGKMAGVEGLRVATSSTSLPGVGGVGAPSVTLKGVERLFDYYSTPRTPGAGAFAGHYHETLSTVSDDLLEEILNNIEVPERQAQLLTAWGKLFRVVREWEGNQTKGKRKGGRKEAANGPSLDSAIRATLQDPSLAEGIHGYKSVLENPPSPMPMDVQLYIVLREALSLGCYELAVLALKKLTVGVDPDLYVMAAANGLSELVFSVLVMFLHHALGVEGVLSAPLLSPQHTVFARFLPCLTAVFDTLECTSYATFRTGFFFFVSQEDDILDTFLNGTGAPSLHAASDLSSVLSNSTLDDTDTQHIATRCLDTDSILPEKFKQIYLDHTNETLLGNPTQEVARRSSWWVAKALFEGDNKTEGEGEGGENTLKQLRCRMRSYLLFKDHLEGCHKASPPEGQKENENENRTNALTAWVMSYRRFRSKEDRSLTELNIPIDNLFAPIEREEDCRTKPHMRGFAQCSAEFTNKMLGGCDFTEKRYQAVGGTPLSGLFLTEGAYMGFSATKLFSESGVLKVTLKKSWGEMLVVQQAIPESFVKAEILDQRRGNTRAGERSIAMGRHAFKTLRQLNSTFSEDSIIMTCLPLLKHDGKAFFLIEFLRNNGREEDTNITTDTTVDDPPQSLARRRSSVRPPPPPTKSYGLCGTVSLACQQAQCKDKERLTYYVEYSQGVPFGGQRSAGRTGFLRCPESGSALCPFRSLAQCYEALAVLGVGGPSLRGEDLLSQKGFSVLELSVSGWTQGDHGVTIEPIAPLPQLQVLSFAPGNLILDAVRCSASHVVVNGLVTDQMFSVAKEARFVVFCNIFNVSRGGEMCEIPDFARNKVHLSHMYCWRQHSTWEHLTHPSISIPPTDLDVSSSASSETADLLEETAQTRLEGAWGEVTRSFAALPGVRFRVPREPVCRCVVRVGGVGSYLSKGGLLRVRCVPPPAGWVDKVTVLAMLGLVLPASFVCLASTGVDIFEEANGLHCIQNGVLLLSAEGPCIRIDPLLAGWASALILVVIVPFRYAGRALVVLDFLSQ